MSRHLLSVCVCLVASVSFAAAPPAPQRDTKKIKALIEQLGDADFLTRARAEADLEKEGADALPVLRSALTHKDVEVRRRALRLIPAIENKILFAPRRVTFSVKNQPLSMVLAELGKASGYKINDNTGVPGFLQPAQPQPKQPDATKEKLFSYDFRDQPFWDVVDRICRDANLTVQPGYSDDIVRLTRSKSFAPFTGRSGPFRYVANSLQMYRNVELSSADAQPRTESLTFNFTIQAEPRLPLMSMGDVRVESAYDDLNNSMLLEREPVQQNTLDVFGMRMGRGGRFYSGNYKQLALSGSVQLGNKTGRATKLKSIKCIAPVTVLVEQRPVVITEKVMESKGTKKEIGDLTFEITEVKTPQAGQVSVGFTITHKNTTDYSWQNNLYTRIELQDEKGLKYQNWGSSWGGSGAGQMRVTMTFNSFGQQKPGDPTKFIFVHWETKMYDVHFEFKDIPLP